MNDGIARVVDKVASDVERVGWSAISVAPRADGSDEPGEGEPRFFTYTVGLRLRGLPDLIVTGMPPVTAHGVLTGAIDVLTERGDAPPPGEPLDRVLVGYPVRLGDVSDRWRDELMRFAAAYYDGEAFEARQVLWPDAEGRFPGEPGSATSSQAVLG